MKAIIFTDMNASIGLGRYAGPYRIASEYRKRGMEVKVVDFMMSFNLFELKNIVDMYSTSETEWIGISSTFLATRDFNKFSNRIQIRDQLEQSTSVGLSIDEATKFFDYCRSKNLRILIGGARLKHDFKDVEWINGQGELSLFKDFDFNKSQILWNKEDHIFEHEHLPIEIARGCIFKCSFCGFNLNGKKLWDWCKSPEVVYEEMIRNYTEFGTTGYMFSDDTYNDSPVKVKMFRDMFKTLPFNLEFTTYARLDLIASKWETMDMLAESGMKSVFFGVESLNHPSGKSIGKGMHPDKIKDAIYRIKDEYPDILICAGFIAGLPHETIETLEETIKWLENSPIDSYSYQTLSIGTKSNMGLDPKKYGYKFDENNKWYNEHMSWKEANELAETASRGTLSAFTFYSRLRNLDYLPAEVKLITEKDEDEINFRNINKIYSYKEKVLGYNL